MKISSNKCNAICFTRGRVKDPLNYSLGDQKIQEACYCKYLGIIVRNDLSWADQVNLEDTTFRNTYCKKGKQITKFLTYTSL